MKIAGDGSLEGLWQCLGEMLKEDIDNTQKQMSVDENDEVDHSQNENIEELGKLFIASFYQINLKVISIFF